MKGQTINRLEVLAQLFKTEVGRTFESPKDFADLHFDSRFLRLCPKTLRNAHGQEEGEEWPWSDIAEAVEEILEALLPVSEQHDIETIAEFVAWLDGELEMTRFGIDEFENLMLGRVDLESIRFTLADCRNVSDQILLVESVLQSYASVTGISVRYSNEGSGDVPAMTSVSLTGGIYDLDLLDSDVQALEEVYRHLIENQVEMKKNELLGQGLEESKSAQRVLRIDRSQVREESIGYESQNDSESDSELGDSLIRSVQGTHPQVSQHLARLERDRLGRIIWPGTLNDLGFVIDQIEGKNPRKKVYEHYAQFFVRQVDVRASSLENAASRVRSKSAEPASEVQRLFESG